MEIIHDPAGLARFDRPAFVPTMGALHAGHLALVQRAAEFNRPVVVSIFVNPAQFAPEENYTQYPRTLGPDCARAEASGVAAVFAPDEAIMYPPECDDTALDPAALSLPDVATRPGLEDRSRPGHFIGVRQAVMRLFDLVQPGPAIFGEKDYQQLLMVGGLAATAGDRWPGLEIIGHPTVRESDGLAFSSRNTFLGPDQREQALGLSRALNGARDAAAPGRPVRRVEEQMRAALVRHRLEIDYAVIRDAETLQPIDDFDRPARALIAAQLDEVRLIDNMDVTASS